MCLRNSEILQIPKRTKVLRSTSSALLSKRAARAVNSKPSVFDFTLSPNFIRGVFTRVVMALQFTPLSLQYVRINMACPRYTTMWPGVAQLPVALHRTLARLCVSNTRSLAGRCVRWVAAIHTESSSEEGDVGTCSSSGDAEVDADAAEDDEERDTAAAQGDASTDGAGTGGGDGPAFPDEEGMVVPDDVGLVGGGNEVAGDEGATTGEVDGLGLVELHAISMPTNAGHITRASQAAQMGDGTELSVALTHASPSIGQSFEALHRLNPPSGWQMHGEEKSHFSRLRLTQSKPAWHESGDLQYSPVSAEPGAIDPDGGRLGAAGVGVVHLESTPLRVGLTVILQEPQNFSVVLLRFSMQPSLGLVQISEVEQVVAPRNGKQKQPSSNPHKPKAELTQTSPG